MAPAYQLLEQAAAFYQLCLASTISPGRGARDLGLSRASVYRLLKAGVLRRFRDGIAQTKFENLLKEHPEVIPYHKLSLLHKEWLVLSGFKEPSLKVKHPNSAEWIKESSRHHCPPSLRCRRR